MPSVPADMLKPDLSKVTRTYLIIPREPLYHDARLARIGIYREQGNANMARLHLPQLRNQFPDDRSLDPLWRVLDS